MKFVAIVVGRYNIKKQDVFGFGVQAGYAEFHLGKHLPGERDKFEIQLLNIVLFFWIILLKTQLSKIKHLPLNVCKNKCNHQFKTHLINFINP